MKKALALLTLLISTSNSFCMYNKQTSLHQAAARGSIEQVRFLLEHGAQVNARDEARKTPLHYAAQGGSDLVVNLLLDRGAQIDAQDTDLQTALYCAILFNKLDTAKLLVGRRACLALQSSNGNTPLHLAVLYNFTDIIVLLLNHGASLDIPNKEGRTPPHMVIKLETLKTLLFQNCNVPAVWPVIKDKQIMPSLKDICLSSVHNYLVAGKIIKKDLEKIPDALKHEITKGMKLAYMKYVLYSLGKSYIRPLYLEAKDQIAPIVVFTNQVLKAKKLDDLKALGYQE